MDTQFEYNFPAIRGIQAGREYYVSMCPLKLIPKIFVFDEEELVPELRAQRILNKNRVPEISSYIVDNQDSYVFSAITASINGDTLFEPLGSEGNKSRIGALRIDMQAQFIINDGQHRRAAIEKALKEHPELGDETIAVVFFIDKGLKRCQQMFADLNRYAVKPSKSLGLLYDYRDDKAQLAKRVVLESKVFKNLVEMEKTTLSARSRKLFTLSAIYAANTALLHGIDIKSQDEAAEICIRFWDSVGGKIPEWEMVRKSKITSGEVRQDFIHSHAITLQAIAIVGNQEIRQGTTPDSALNGLEKIDWARDNAAAWEGRATVGGRVSKSSNQILLTGIQIKKYLGMPLLPDEQKVEDKHMKGKKNMEGSV